MTSNHLEEKLAVFIDRCKKIGFSVTHQRLAIYTELIRSKEHPSTEMIYRKVHKKFPTISLATVYKTLNTFSTLQLVKLVNTSQDLSRYDGNLELHHHFICQECGTVEDIPLSVIGPIKLPDKVVKQYNIVNYGVVLNGICTLCQKKLKKGIPQKQ